MEVIDFDRVMSAVSLAALVGLALLVPLFLSQRRDLERLRELMEREPEYPASDLRASELLLDRAEVELERIYAERGEPVPGAEPAAAATEVRPPELEPGRLSPASRVTGDRPALTRITMERAALEPHPRWRRFVGRATQPRWLAAVAVVAALVAGAAIVGSERLLQSDEDAPSAPAGAIDPASVEVAVLNGTTTAGLADKVGSDVEANGYTLGDVGNIEGTFEQTIVQFEPGPGNRRAAESVARDLGRAPVQRISGQAQELAGGAEVVVIAGEDRAL